MRQPGLLPCVQSRAWMGSEERHGRCPFSERLRDAADSLESSCEGFAWDDSQAVSQAAGMTARLMSAAGMRAHGPHSSPAPYDALVRIWPGALRGPASDGMLPWGTSLDRDNAPRHKGLVWCTRNDPAGAMFALSSGLSELYGRWYRSGPAGLAESGAIPAAMTAVAEAMRSAACAAEEFMGSPWAALDWVVDWLKDVSSAAGALRAAALSQVAGSGPRRLDPMEDCRRRLRELALCPPAPAMRRSGESGGWAAVGPSRVTVRGSLSASREALRIRQEPPALPSMSRVTEMALCLVGDVEQVVSVHVGCPEDGLIAASCAEDVAAKAAWLARYAERLCGHADRMPVLLWT